MVRAMANAPALLRGYLDFTRAMKRSHIDRRITERINLAVHEWLSCDYCLLAHTRAARKLGVPDRENLLARQGTSTDPAIAAIVAFAQQVLAGPAEITDADIGRLHEHGYRDEQIAEVTGLVALQLLTGASTSSRASTPRLRSCRRSRRATAARARRRLGVPSQTRDAVAVT